MAAITVEQAFRTALAFQQAGQTAAAEALYRQILAAEPHHAEVWQRLGVIASTTGRREEAIASFRRAAELRPDAVGPHNNLGGVLAEIGAWDEAIESLQRALALDPHLAEAHSNLGKVFTDLERYDEALAALGRARKLKPDSPGIYKNLGSAFFRAGRFGEAMACYREWVAAHPADPTAHRSLGQVLLCLGRFEEGWKEFEWRERDPDAAWVHRQFAASRWPGQALPGGTLFLHAEQGFGDTIHFVRYLPLVCERAAAHRVIVECPPKLVRLLRRSFDPPVEIVARPEVTAGAWPPPCDQQSPLMSLPLALRTFEPLPMREPYLRVDADWRAAWRARLGPAARRRVGLAWAGSAVHVNDRRRSIAPGRLLPLLAAHRDIEFYQLPVERLGDAGHLLRESGLIDLTEHLADFADTAALVAELDLIISVDTAVAHLAGALGRPVWTLLPHAPDWRWGLDREDTPWYPTMRLFRQEKPGDWDAVIQRVIEALRHPG